MPPPTGATATGVTSDRLAGLRRWKLALTGLHLAQAVGVLVLAALDHLLTATITAVTAAIARSSRSMLASLRSISHLLRSSSGRAVPGPTCCSMDDATRGSDTAQPRTIR